MKSSVEHSAAQSAATAARLTVLIAHRYPLVSAGLASMLQHAEEWDLELLECSNPGPQELSGASVVDVVISDATYGLKLAGRGPGHHPEADTHRPRLIVVRTPEDRPSEAADDVANIDEALSIECLGEELLSALRRVSCKIATRFQNVAVPSDRGSTLSKPGGITPSVDQAAPLGVQQVTEGAESAARATNTLVGKSTAIVPAPRGGLAPGALRRVTEYMQHRLSEHICLGELADIAGLSESHFARAFRESVGEPPHRYLMLLRVRAAATLIESTNRPLAEISLAVGFADQSHLTRLFIRLVGERPREYRRRHR